MVIQKIDPLLNDAEINYLCDLFLSSLGFDMRSRHYRYFRNAVIVASHDIFRPRAIYAALAECAGTDRAAVADHIKTALRELPTPVADAYNSAFVARNSDGTCITPVMRDGLGPDGTIAFLGTVFLYIVVSYYPKYSFVVYRPNPDRQ